MNLDYNGTFFKPVALKNCHNRKPLIILIILATSDQLLKLTGIVTKRLQRCRKSVWLLGVTALVSRLPVLHLYSFWIPSPNTSQFCSSPGVPSDINQVLLPLRHPKVSISLCCPFCLSFPLHVHLSILSSAQSEGWSCRAALYLCSNWPGGKPEVRLLPSHHQYTHLPLHSQVHLCKVVKWFSPKGEILCGIRVNLFYLSGSVISRGLKCFTNFSTTWLITSKKGR